VNTLGAKFLAKKSLNLVRVINLVMSQSSSNLGHWGQKQGHKVISLNNLMNTLGVTLFGPKVMKLRIIVSMIWRGQVWIWAMLGQNLGYKAFRPYPWKIFWTFNSISFRWAIQGHHGPLVLVWLTGKAWESDVEQTIHLSKTSVFSIHQPPPYCSQGVCYSCTVNLI
jgi:hypothetical protein